MEILGYNLSPKQQFLATIVCFELTILAFYYFGDSEDEKTPDTTEEKPASNDIVETKTETLWQKREVKQIKLRDPPKPPTKEKSICRHCHRAGSKKHSVSHANRKEPLSDWEDYDSDYDVYDYSSDSEPEVDTTKEVKFLYRKA